MNRLVARVFVLGGALAVAAGACTTTTTHSGQRDAGGDVLHQLDGGLPDGGGDGGGGACTQTGFTAVEETADATSSRLLYNGYSTASTTFPNDSVGIEFWYGLGGQDPPMGAGTVTIGASADDRDYATCATCVMIWVGCDDTGACTQVYMATSGTLTVTEMTPGGNFVGTIANARFVEVTIDPNTYASTPVAGGATWCLPSYAFDAALSGTLPCTSNTDCAGSADTPYCDTTNNQCVQCLEESHCSALAATPHCDTGTFTCVECLTDANCSTSSFGHFCGANLCGSCKTSFDCATAAAPVCVTSKTTDRAECGVGDACTPDDASEPGDDGPAGARVLTTASSLTGKVCDAANQSDFFKFDNAAAGNVTFTLTWTITNTSDAEDLDLYIYDSTGEVLGKAENGQGTETVLLTYLPVGTFYAQVTAYSMGAATAPIPYTMAVAYAAATCSADADCAANYANQYLRGKCQAGACIFIHGAGALAEGAACDSLDDCASGLCTYGGYATDYFTYFIDYHFMKDSDTRGYCVASQCQDNTDCVSPKVCSQGFCLPKCTESAQCPVAGPGTTVTIDGWTHATCNTTTGVCEY